ncbi:hypothetical protein B0E46_11810 [Rhodanobacter sp. B04]|uniref:hypothetical protein n=1 Tax=Rhodanobacter sp. B04 TaxID=1945860 RepID=UPI0009CE0542|nr:hypothetical protein [Rhodanobacter sp. B04]OOG62894.1 hypothetical protein B0E46_11810 [Rhodanobacter sp. B04]
MMPAPASSRRRGNPAARPAGLAPLSSIVHAIFPSRRGLLPAARQLIDCLTAEFEQLAGEDQPPR